MVSTKKPEPLQPTIIQKDSIIKKYNIEFNNTYLIKEPKPIISYSIFLSLIHEGIKGLCITRIKPDELHAKYDLKDTPLIWLTRNRVEAVKCIEPTNITRLSMEIVDFIQDTGKGMILFEGIEYLISQNSYPIILRFIQLLNDKIMLGNSGMLIPLNPLILQESELYMLERDMKTLP